MKTIGKIESVAEFLARGGKINKVPMNVGKRSYKKAVDKAQVESEIDYSALPAELRAKYVK